MKQSLMSSPQAIPVRYSDLETDIPRKLTEVPFSSDTDPLILRLAVKEAFRKKAHANRDQSGGTTSRPEPVSR